MAQRPPTSVDVAHAAGVSQATVSRVLNGHNVSEKIRDAVFRAIEELDYRPNSSARSLVTNRTNIVGVVVGDILNGYYAEMLETIRTQLAASDYRTLVITDTGAEPGDPGELLWAAHVDGAIITTSLILPSHERLIVNRDLPTVSMNRAEDVSRDAVVADNLRGGRLAAEHLLGLGHRQIATFTGPLDALSIQDRQAGFVAGLHEAGLSLAPNRVVVADLDYGRAHTAALELLSSPDRPSAIFCHNDQMAFATLNAAAAIGLDVPGELSVLGFDDVKMSSWERIQLTTVRQPIEDMAITSTEMLFRRLNNPERQARTVTLPCELVERSTTSRIPG